LIIFRSSQVNYLWAIIFVKFASMKNIVILSIIFFAVACNSSDKSQETASESEEVIEAVEENASTNGVSFNGLEDGSTLSSPFLLEMGVEGMIVEPKGAPREGYGHHHLLINDDYAPAGTVIVADDTHIHYGGGQTSDSIALEPGEYKLTLQFADGMHVSYGEQWAKSINVTVE